MLLSEINANQSQRRRERERAEQRRRDRTVRVDRRVELPTTCARCGAKLKEVKATGRPRLYCSPACRKAAYEDRRAHRDGAVKVQVVEKLITEVRERRIEVPHPRSDCINAVLDWQFATTYASGAPHEYVVADRTPGLTEDDVTRAAHVIRTYGEPMKFYKETRIYLVTPTAGSTGTCRAESSTTTVSR